MTPDPPPTRQIVVRLAPTLRPLDSRIVPDLAGVPILSTVPGQESATLSLPGWWSDLEVQRWVAEQQRAGRLAAVGPEGQPEGYRLAHPAVWVPWAGKRAVRRSEAVVGPFTALPYDDARLRRDWSLHGVSEDTQRRGRYGRGVALCILDTWCDSSHPAFGAGVVWQGGPGADGQSHATHVTGIAHHIAPEADLLLYNGLPGGAGSEQGLQAGFVALADEVQRRGYGSAVVNCSFGTDSMVSAVIGDGVRYAQARGLIVVAAAGNRRGARPGSPAQEADWRIVALQPDGRTPASYATLLDGLHQRAGAVGDRVFSTLPGGGWGEASGSSMASPVVSGLAALYWASLGE